MDVKIEIAAILACLLSTLVLKVLDLWWFRPKKLERFLRRQSFDGNPYRPFFGDLKDYTNTMKAEQPKSIGISEDIIPHIFPYYQQTIDRYGKGSFVWFGPSPRITITDPEMINEVLKKPGVFQKPLPDPIGRTIAGGLLSLEDQKRIKHRKIINPAFHLDKLKNMTKIMHLSCSEMVATWEALVSGSGNTGEVDVWPYLENLTGDVISRTAFGSCHQEGRKILEFQREQVKQILKLQKFYFIPGWRHIPTKANRRMKTLAAEIQTLLRGIINKRLDAMAEGEVIYNDLLGLLMESNSSQIKENGDIDKGMSMEDIMEECKLFYFAGSETTSNSLAWTMVLLSKHQDWQKRARDEVLQAFGMKEPTFDGLSHLKVVTMILQEALRLYPPAPQLNRATVKPVKLGDMILPEGVQLTLLLTALHRDPVIWGPDAKEFNPERFANGVASAANEKFSFLPFSSGPRVCVGQNFAMLQAKMALTLILQHFSFELSPSYLHAPFAVITLQPQHGVPLILHKRQPDAPCY